MAEKDEQTEIQALAIELRSAEAQGKYTSESAYNTTAATIVKTTTLCKALEVCSEFDNIALPLANMQQAEKKYSQCRSILKKDCYCMQPKFGTFSGICVVCNSSLF